MVEFTPEMMAPCGINCGTCIAFLRSKNNCAGCRVHTHDMPVSRQRCIIRNCAERAVTSSGQCADCSIFPCKRLRQLDKRYSTRYHQSLINNLLAIRESGMNEFLKAESEKWSCTSCASTLSIHRENCMTCGQKKIIKTV